MIRAKEDFKPETLKFITTLVDLGYLHFSWDKLCEQVLIKEIGEGEINREKSTRGWRFFASAAESAAKLLRSYYPNREKAWSEALGPTVSREAIEQEVWHIANLIMFEYEFSKLKKEIVKKPGNKNRR